MPDPTEGAPHPVARGTGTLGKRPVCAIHGTEMTTLHGRGWWCWDCNREAVAAPGDE